MKGHTKQEFVIYGIYYTEGICTGFIRIQGGRHIFVIPEN